MRPFGYSTTSNRINSLALEKKYLTMYVKNPMQDGLVYKKRYGMSLRDVNEPFALLSSSFRNISR